MSDLLVLQRLLLSAAIAGAIGYERERHGRAAGFRTHILVGVGSCLIMLTGLYLRLSLTGADFDPTRMAAQVISGIGFLGAGTILRSRASIRGLTTAASLWAVAGIGLAMGAGFLSGAVAAGVIVGVVLFGLSRLERAMRKEQYQMLLIDTAGSAHDLARIRGLLAEYDVEIRDLEIKESGRGDVRLELQVKLLSDEPREDILRELTRLERVTAAHWA